MSKIQQIISFREQILSDIFSSISLILNFDFLEYNSLSQGYKSDLLLCSSIQNFPLRIRKL